MFSVPIESAVQLLALQAESVVPLPLQFPLFAIYSKHVTVVPIYALQSKRAVAHFLPLVIHPDFHESHSEFVFASLSSHFLIRQFVPLISPIHNPSEPMYPLHVSALPLYVEHFYYWVTHPFPVVTQPVLYYPHSLSLCNVVGALVHTRAAHLLVVESKSHIPSIPLMLGHDVDVPE